MTTSTTRDKNTRLSPALRLGAVAVWLLLWQLASMAVGLPLLLPSPLAVLLRLGQLCTGADFWLTVASSLLRILLGFLLGVLFGTALAGLCWRFRLIDALARPLLGVLKSTPVASFIILALVWVKTTWLATVISFIMVLPLIYANVREGIDSADRQLLEMAQVFRLSRRKTFRYCYLPAILPSFSRRSAARWALPGSRASPPRCWAVRRGRSAARSTTRKSTWKRPTCLPGRWWSSCCRCCWSALPCALSDGRGNDR